MCHHRFYIFLSLSPSYVSPLCSSKLFQHWAVPDTLLNFPLPLYTLGRRSKCKPRPTRCLFFYPLSSMPYIHIYYTYKAVYCNIIFLEVSYVPCILLCLSRCLSARDTCARDAHAGIFAPGLPRFLPLSTSPDRARQGQLQDLGGRRVEGRGNGAARAARRGFDGLVVGICVVYMWGNGWLHFSRCILE